MKMRASASLIFQRKTSSPKMINNINNEVMTNGRFIQGDSYLEKEDITSRLVLPSLTPQLTISPVQIPLQNVVQPNGISARVEEESKLRSTPSWLDIFLDNIPSAPQCTILQHNKNKIGISPHFMIFKQHYCSFVQRSVFPAFIFSSFSLSFLIATRGFPMLFS